MTQVVHADREHALLSASSAHRWLACTPSARLEDTLPDTTSDAAIEGTLAHEIAELKLRKHFIEPMGPKKFNAALKKFKEHRLYDEEILRHTDTYLNYVQGVVHSFTSPPYVALEKRLNFTIYVPEGFGTGDCIVIGGNTLVVIDFKYGKGKPVEAEGNPQMRLYALAAYEAYKMLYPIETIKMVIIQPRLDRQPEESMSVTDLLAWGEGVKPIAQQAFNGTGEYVPGDHCGFCRAKATCRARVDQYSALKDFTQLKPPLISNEEVGEMLQRAEGIVSWYESLKKFALTACLTGDGVPGWKAVNGRGSRDYFDQDAAFAHLIESGIAEAILYERKPLTVPAVEKVLKGKDFKLLLEDTGHVIKSVGAPTLAPESDKREAITRQSASDDFQHDIGQQSPGGNEE